MSYPNAAQGLRLMFLGRMVMIAGLLVSWVPFVGSLLMIASPVLELVGIYKAGDDDENYRGALVFAALVLAANFIAGLLGEGFLRFALEAAASVLNLLMVYSVCTTTSNLLHSVGQEALSQRGRDIIKIYTACVAVSLVCTVLGVIPIVNIAAALVSGLSSLVLLAGYVMYLLFLNGSSKVL